MAIKGRLEDLRLSSVLQLLTLSDASGRLRLTQSAGEGLIILREGRIIFAASSSVRETLGNMLLCRGLISEAQLRRALEIQHGSDTECRLGTVLVEAGFVSQDVLEKSVTRQIQRVMGELLGWTKGFYRFDRLELVERGEVEVEPRDFVAVDGVDANKLLMDELAGQFEREEEVPEPARSLGSLMREFRTPSFVGEVTIPLLVYARNLTHRGALFSASPGGFRGVAQFGFDADDVSAAERIRAICLPLGEPSVFREAIARREPHVLAPADNSANRDLLVQLGGGWPQQALIAPLIVSGRVLMIFYGDNLPKKDPIGSIEGLSEVLLRSAVSMERSLLESRIEHAKQLRNSRS